MEGKQIYCQNPPVPRALFTMACGFVYFLFYGVVVYVQLTHNKCGVQFGTHTHGYILFGHYKQKGSVVNPDPDPCSNKQKKVLKTLIFTIILLLFRLFYLRRLM
jgi:hypothetical protein